MQTLTDSRPTSTQKSRQLDASERSTAGAVPWAWQDKRVLRRIRKAFDSQNVVASALAVYHALTEIASDEAVDEFTTTIPHVAHRSGLSPRTTGQRIADLARLGVLAVQTPKLKAPSTYRLLPFDSHSPTTGNGCRTISNGCAATGNGCRTFGKREAPRLRTVEEMQEKNTLYKRPSLEEVKLQAVKAGLPDTEAERFFNFYESNGWKVGRNPMKSWTHALANWKLRDNGQRHKPTTPPPDHSKGF